uniref:Uncharacterized protein n=1 Tax=Cajanus cajan TaxID=3821 RepID=A0A151S0I9_CAJCA|nr:hypothetical protein KK1_030012 [Cajanus cajan]
MVTAYLFKFMDPTIGKPFMFLPITRDIWEVMKKTCSDLDNQSQLFELTTWM